MTVGAGRVERRFDAKPEAVAEVRHFVFGELVGHDPEVRGDATLVASELASNAVQHAMAGFTVSVESDEYGIRIEVCDGACTPPRPRSASRTDGSGRGLRLVGAVSDDWGCAENPDGKTVWAIIGPSSPRRGE